MDETTVNPDAQRENIRALMVAAGIAEEEAAMRLTHMVLVTCDCNDYASRALMDEVTPLLSKTLSVTMSPKDGANYGAELILGRAKARTDLPKVFAVMREDGLIISQSPVDSPSQMPLSGLLVLLAACYTTGAVIGFVVGAGIPNLPPPDFDIPFDAFTDIDPKSYKLIGEINLGEAYLVGAGAIGNGFLYAARYASLRGKLHVVDDDKVSAGNLQRQIWFKTEDVGEYKAKILCERAQVHFRECELIPAICRLQNHPNKNGGAWLGRMIVAVDSRRARRELQNELPREVFDASTTGSEEIVLHHNVQPSELACLGCIYFSNEQEVSQDQAIAAHLGLSIEDVRQPRITGEMAVRICKVHPDLTPEDIEGGAFDSLYKARCSAQKLRSIEGKQVVAPFAFVSVLAGVLLLLEIIHKQHGLKPEYNLWKVSPWYPPVVAKRENRQRRQSCECCGNVDVREFQAKLWTRKA